MMPTHVAGTIGGDRVLSVVSLRLRPPMDAGRWLAARRRTALSGLEVVA